MRLAELGLTEGITEVKWTSGDGREGLTPRKDGRKMGWTWEECR